jgi:hypothetical protein
MRAAYLISKYIRSEVHYIFFKQYRIFTLYLQSGNCMCILSIIISKSYQQWYNDRFGTVMYIVLTFIKYNNEKYISKSMLNCQTNCTDFCCIHLCYEYTVSGILGVCIWARQDVSPYIQALVPFLLISYRESNGANEIVSKTSKYNIK